MTVQEFRLDLLKRGFTTRETMIGNKLFFIIYKLDTDNLRVEWEGYPDEEIYYKAGNAIFVDRLRKISADIDNTITNRHSQNTNNCQHEEVMIGSLLACNKCMAKFGEKITMNLRFN